MLLTQSLDKHGTALRPGESTRSPLWAGLTPRKPPSEEMTAEVSVVL